jgi:ribosomal protein S18 acetylase RimI-like enzyme
MRIRRCDPMGADLNGIHDLLGLVYPRDKSMSLDGLANFLKRLTSTSYNGHWVADRGGQIVGRLSITEPWFASIQSTIMVFLEVHPLCRGVGLGRALWLQAADFLHDRPYESVVCKVDDGDSGAVNFVRNRGLVSELTLTQSEFSLEPHKLETLKGVAKPLERAGIKLIDGIQLTRESPLGWRERWWRLQQTISRDVPSPEPWVDQPLDVFVKDFLDCPSTDPTLWQFAVDGDELVGLSGLRVASDLPAVAVVGLTGVLRSHRRRNLARALKSISAARAYDSGVRTIVTENEKSNPMLKLNLSLGFQITHTESIYRGPIPNQVYP